jgi:oxygen-independent coproporphyrinogen-3 oxidase
VTPPPRHVYVHVPFCARRCSYCDFSIAVRREVPVDDYLRGLDRELAIRYRDSERSRESCTVDTLYFGGGTPSRLGAGGVARAIETITSRLRLADGAEVTLEANPEDVSESAVAAWRSAGITRLSIGAQSFDNRVLAWMHRTHDSAAISRAVELARGGGIDNLSIDLIFALPESLGRSWEADLDRALLLDSSHISLYGLTIEPHTPLGRWQASGRVTESPDDHYEREFLLANEIMRSAGFEHYEVSNFARPGRRSLHNSSYWSGNAYAGLGPSAHGFDGAARRWNASGYVDWLHRIDAGSDPMEGTEVLSDDNRAAEAVYLGLRTTAGLTLAPRETLHVRPWIDAGWAIVDADHRLSLTPLGWLRLDTLAANLTLFRSR